MICNDNNQKVELIIWMNGKPKNFSFLYNLSLTYTTTEQLKISLTNYIYEDHKLQKLFNLPKNSKIIEHLFTKNEVELEDSDMPYLKNNDVLFFSFDILSTYSPNNNYNQYEFIRPLKSGGFGKVFLVKEVLTGTEYAIKEISIEHFSNEELYNISREYMILKDMSHKNIIKFHSYFTYNNKFYTVMDYARGGELSALLESKKKLTEEEAKFIFKQIYNAVCYIHGKNIIHRDLKPNNILFLDEQQTQIVIIDFGIAGFSNGNQKEIVRAGTDRFLPPEMVSGKNFLSTTKLDMWALGVILYRMVEGCYPFEGKTTKNNNSSKYNIFKNKMEFNPKIKLSSALKNLLEGLLEKNHRFRIDNDNILFLKWFEHKIQVDNSIKRGKKDDNNSENDFINKYYSDKKYCKYYEDDNERKLIQALIKKANNNSYLSQTKSTSIKCKPKMYFNKNDYSLKKSNIPFKVEINRILKKKSFEGNIHKIENDNENEKFTNQIILPLIKSTKDINRKNGKISKDFIK